MYFLFSATSTAKADTLLNEPPQASLNH
jgi:hypothetical protein